MTVNLRGHIGGLPIIGWKDGIVLVEIIPKFSADFDSGLKVFPMLADAGVSVDFIDIKPSRISFIFDVGKTDKSEKILSEFNCQLKKGFAKVSVIGAGMTGQSGIISRIVQILHDNNIRIYECTDSHTTISCLVNKKDQAKAVRALHSGFEHL